MSRYTVLVTDYAWPTLEIEQEILAGVDATLLVAAQGDEEELTALAPQADAILTCWRQVPPAALDQASKCRLVSRYGIGLDNIPVEYATQLGMLVTNVPDFCLEEVADHTMALLLACARQLLPLHQTVRQGKWSRQTPQPIPRLRGRTLGLIGYGNIARTLAPRALSFGLNLMVYTPRITPDDLAGMGEVTTNLNHLLASADYLSIHAPATDQTRGLIGEEALRQMKPTAVLINTARGSIVDEIALYRALTEGWIAGAALDVTDPEPPAAHHPLLHLENVLVTPHAAFYSEEAIQDLQRKAATHVAQTLSGQIPTNLVNPQVLKQANCRLPIIN